MEHFLRVCKVLPFGRSKRPTSVWLTSSRLRVHYESILRRVRSPAWKTLVNPASPSFPPHFSRLEPLRDDSVAQKRRISQKKCYCTLPLLFDKRKFRRRMARTQTVIERRSAELRTLKSEGFPIRFVSRWHIEIGPLSVWIAAGRWHNTVTDERGRIKRRMLRELVTPILEPLIARGRHLYPDQEHRAKEERRRHEEFLTGHEEYMNALTSWRGGRTGFSAESSQQNS
jgi:hypothetical protein